MSNMTLPWFLQRFTYPDGRPLSGGKVYFYVGGSTSLPKNVYTDHLNTLPITQPLILDASGIAPQYYCESGLYKIVVQDSAGAMVATRDYVAPAGDGSSAPGDHKVLTNGSDGTPGYLADKVQSGPGITLGTVTAGTDIDLVISSQGKVAVSGTDLQLDYLSSKIIDTAGIKWTIQGSGANEKYIATVDLSGVDDAFKVKTMGSDPAGYLKDKLASSSQITKLTDSDGVISFELADGLRPTGLAGGDLTGTYPNPLVKELSGLGTSFSPVPAVMAGTSTPLQFGGSGGRGIAFKVVRGYGLAIDSIGQLYSTQDGGLTWRKAAYFVYPTDLGADITYGKYDGTNYGWVFVEGRDQVIKYLPDIPANYDANGVPLSSAWVTVTNATSISWGDITWNDAAGYWLAAGNSTNILRRASLTTGDWANVKTLSAVAGGVAVTNTGRTVAFERDTGVVWYSDTISAATPTWTKVTNGGFTPTITNILDYASMTTTGVWGSAVYGDGMVAFADYNAGLIVTTTDVADYSKYQLSVKANSLPGIYDITYDGANWYATNGSTTAPAVYQLFIGSIPSHRPFVAEKGEKVLGQLTLPELPNAPFVGTDAWGNIVAKSAPSGTSGNGYASTMYIANATQTLAPNLIVRSELVTLFVPTMGMRVYQGLQSKFGAFIAQGGTGLLMYTLRDSSYRLIAQSYQTTNPTAQVFLELDCGAVYDPATGLTVPYYDLDIGGRYYLGINWSANGMQLLGDDAVQLNNTQPYTAYKVDNLSSVPTQLTGGGESKQRPFVRLLTKVP